MVLCCANVAVMAQLYNDPNFDKPTTGYGADGPYTTVVEAFDNPYYPGQDIKIYHPAEITTQVPTVFIAMRMAVTYHCTLLACLLLWLKRAMPLFLCPTKQTG